MRTLKLLIVSGCIVRLGLAGDESHQAAAAMAASLAAQRASVARQLGQQSSSSFFLLTPPAKMGTAPPVAVTMPATAPISPPARLDCDPITAAELDPLIQGAAERESLQPELLRSMMRQESGFRPCAVSPKGAMGLMQLMPGTAAQLGVRDPFNPKENVDAGARFFKQLLNLYDDLPLALGAYNAGQRRVDEAGGVPNIPETVNYVQRIMSLMSLKP